MSPSTATSPSPASWSTRRAPPGRRRSSRFALALTVCGIFAEGFMVRGWIYSIIGGVVALFAFRSMVRDAIRELLPPAAQAARPRRRPAGRNRSRAPAASR